MSKTPGAGQRVLLVVPPFQTTSHPALGVSQLKANLGQAGFPTQVLYLNLRLAERIGLDAYETIGVAYGELLGDFVFSTLLFARAEDAVETYVQSVLSGTETEQELRRSFPTRTPAEVIRWLARRASEFCQDAVAEILTADPWLVGLSSSFQQNCASLVMLRAIKRERPDIVTVIGGANCQAEMGEELRERFPEVDYVCQGEADHSLVELVRQLRQGKERPAVPSFLTRFGGATPAGRPLTSEDLEGLPHPDFDDYFTQLRASPLASRVSPGLVMEASRGCWYGAKHHCTFCGIDDQELVFRKKSAPRVLEEITALVERYHVPYIYMTDLIFDMGYFKSLLPTLAERPRAQLFFESKANLTESQVRLLARSEIRWIRPGIESFSDNSLELMNKGTTKLQNVQLLKSCAQNGIRPFWGYLFGFPGERDDEAPAIAEDIEALHHLQPPECVKIVRLDRFSPYFGDPDAFGLAPVVPAEPYRHVYPFPDGSLTRISYFHHSDFFVRKARSADYSTLKGAGERWKSAFARSYLLAIPGRRALTLIDTRRCSRRLWRRLSGVERQVYEYCDETRRLSQIQGAFPAEEPGRLVEILDSFVQARLMLRSDDARYLSLAVDPRFGYVKFVDPPSRAPARSIGHEDRPRDRSPGGALAYRPWGERRQWSAYLFLYLRLLVTLRLPVRKVLGEISRQASRWLSRSVSLRVLPLLLRILGAGRPG